MSQADELITVNEMKKVQFNRESINKSKVLGPNVRLDYSFEITSKGNGSLILIDRLVRLYDSHDDLAYFKDGLLQNTLIDLNNDGYLDIKLNGIAIITGEKEDVLGEKNVSASLIYNPAENTFDIKSKSNEIYVSERI